MAMSDLEAAVALIADHGDLADFAGERSEEVVAAAEAALQLTFPPTYRRFLRELGVGDIAGREFFGVIDADFDSSASPDVVWVTRQSRERAGLPKSLVVVAELGDGVEVVLDTENARSDGECPAVAWDLQALPDGVVAEDFGAFLLMWVREGLVDAGVLPAPGT